MNSIFQPVEEVSTREKKNIAKGHAEWDADFKRRDCGCICNHSAGVNTHSGQRICHNAAKQPHQLIYIQCQSASQTSQTATYANILSRDPSCLLRDQQQHRITNVFNCSVPIFKPRLLLHRAEKYVHPLRRSNISQDRPRTNRINCDASAPTPLPTVSARSSIMGMTIKSYLGSP